MLATRTARTGSRLPEARTEHEHSALGALRARRRQPRNLETSLRSRRSRLALARIWGDAGAAAGAGSEPWVCSLAPDEGDCAEALRGVPPPPVVGRTTGALRVAAIGAGAGCVEVTGVDGTTGRGTGTATAGAGTGKMGSGYRRREVREIGEGPAGTERSPMQPSRWRPPLPPGQIDVFASFPVPETGVAGFRRVETSFVVSDARWNVAAAKRAAAAWKGRTASAAHSQRRGAAAQSRRSAGRARKGPRPSLASGRGPGRR